MWCDYCANTSDLECQFIFAKERCESNRSCWETASHCDCIYYKCENKFCYYCYDHVTKICFTCFDVILNQVIGVYDGHLNDLSFFTNHTYNNDGVWYVTNIKYLLENSDPIHVYTCEVKTENCYTFECDINKEDIHFLISIIFGSRNYDYTLQQKYEQRNRFSRVSKQLKTLPPIVAMFPGGIEYQQISSKYLK